MFEDRVWFEAKDDSPIFEWNAVVSAASDDGSADDPSCSDLDVEFRFGDPGEDGRYVGEKAPDQGRAGVDSDGVAEVLGSWAGHFDEVVGCLKLR